MPVVPPKIVVGNTVSKIAHTIHDAAWIFGSVRKTKIFSGIFIASEKWITEGVNRNTTFITAEWEIPGRVITKELYGRVVQYVPPEEGGVSITVLIAQNEVVTATTVDVILLNDIGPPQALDNTPVPPVSPLICTPPPIEPVPQLGLTKCLRLNHHHLKYLNLNLIHLMNLGYQLQSLDRNWCIDDAGT